MKISLKAGETVRLETDGNAAVLVYIEDGIVQVTARAKEDKQSEAVLAPTVSMVREMAA